MHYNLDDYILDLVQNAIEASSSRIVLEIDEQTETTRVVLSDNGKGMDAATLARSQDPFFTDGEKHPGRKVGLGIPFLRQMVESIGGSCDLKSASGRGTTLEFTFPTTHIDAPPKGDMAGLLTRLFCFRGEYELVVIRRFPGGSYILRRSELQEALGDLESVGSQSLLSEYISSQEESLETR